MKVCVSCEEDVAGKDAVAVKEDRVIRLIRSVKKTLRIAQMNELYVCSDCMVEHKKKRKSFEKTMLFASLLSALLALLVVIAPLLSGRIEIWGFFSGIILAAFVLTLPVYFKYTPAVEVSAMAAVPAPEAIAKAVKPEKAAKKPVKKKTKRKKKV